MTMSYTQGYRSGWISYLEKYPAPANVLRILAVQADIVSEQASHGLLPQGDFWLGHHHGRNAAESCVALYLDNLSNPFFQL